MSRVNEDVIITLCTKGYEENMISLLTTLARVGWAGELRVITGDTRGLDLGSWPYRITLEPVEGPEAAFRNLDEAKRALTLKLMIYDVCREGERCLYLDGDTVLFDHPGPLFPLLDEKSVWARPMHKKRTLSGISELFSLPEKMTSYNIGVLLLRKPEATEFCRLWKALGPISFMSGVNDEWAFSMAAAILPEEVGHLPDRWDWFLDDGRGFQIENGRAVSMRSGAPISLIHMIGAGWRNAPENLRRYVENG